MNSREKGAWKYVRSPWNTLARVLKIGMLSMLIPSIYSLDDLPLFPPHSQEELEINISGFLGYRADRILFYFFLLMITSPEIVLDLGASSKSIL